MLNQSINQSIKLFDNVVVDWGTQMFNSAPLIVYQSKITYQDECESCFIR